MDVVNAIRRVARGELRAMWEKASAGARDEAIVGAYCALRRAAPDRVRGAPSAGAVYEALVALVLEQDRVGPEARGRTDRDGAEVEPFPFPAANEKDASGTGKENAGTNERPWAEEWSAPDEDVFRGAEPRVTVDE